MIKQVGSQWCLFTKDGKRKLGCHPTKGEAEAQERVVQERVRRAEVLESRFVGDDDSIVITEPRDAAFDPDQPRDDSGKWTSDAAWAASEFPQANVTKSNFPTDVHGNIRGADEIYAGRVGDLSVRRDIPNTSSIGSTFDEGDYDVLPGIREVDVEKLGVDISDYVNVRDYKQTQALAEVLKSSREVNPLIVVANRSEGSYVLEGGHRSRALKLAGFKKAPAMVVVERAKKIRGAFDPDQPRDDQGKWTDGGSLGEAPNTAPDLNFDDAAREMERTAVAEQLEYVQEGTGGKEPLDQDEYIMGTAALEEYTSEGFTHMNSVMRRENGNWERNEDLAALHRYIENAPELDQDITVYRGFRNSGGRDFQVGNEVEMRGFASSSFHPVTALGFAGFHNDSTKVRMFQIRTRRGLVLGDRSAASDTEREVILNHGWKYRVTGIGFVKVHGNVVKVARLEEVQSRRGAEEWPSDVLYTEGDVEMVRYAAFDPDQPRDEDGQWSAGGGSGSGGDDEGDLGELPEDDSDAAVSMAERHRAYMETLESSDDRQFEGFSDAISDYTGDGAAQWNATLRQNPGYMDDDDDDDSDEDDDDRRPSERMAKTMRDFDDAISEAPKLKSPVTVYRGITHELNTKAGDTLTMRGFQSASVRPAVAAKFGKEGSILKIRAKRGLYLGGHSRGGEDEFVMGHNERFKVTRVTKGKINGKTVRVYEVDQQ